VGLVGIGIADNRLAATLCFGIAFVLVTLATIME